MILPVKAGLRFEGATSGFLSDHSRGDLDWSFQEVGEIARMVNGSSRGYILARKHVLSVNWDLLPSDYAMTVDGYWGANDLKAFYLANLGSFTVRVYNRDKAQKTYADNNPELTLTMRFTNFSAAIVKRNVPNGTAIGDLWNVSLELEEV